MYLKMHWVALSFLISLGYSDNTSGQLFTLRGVVMDSDMPIPSATISLLKASDSAWVKSELSDDYGVFELKGVPAGDYIINSSALGYIQGFQLIIIKENDVPEITFVLHKSTTSLPEATISSTKPFIEMSLGKITVNVESSPAAGGANALELLSRSPGVIVSQTGDISLMGRSGVLVLINDRPTYLSADQLADYLKTIPADEIAKIELITQPGARYDASGNAGVINIVMKKNRKQGINGMASFHYSQGIYAFGMGNLLLNYKKNKWNISIHGSDLHATGFAVTEESLNYKDPATGQVTSSSQIHSSPVERFGISTAILSADYDWTDKTTIGCSVKGTYHFNRNLDQLSTTNYDQNNNVTYNKIISPDDLIRKDMSTNLYITHKFNKQNELNINADYLIYANNAQQDITNTVYDARMTPLPYPLLLSSLQPSQISVYSLKADYTRSFKNGIKLEAGCKSSIVNTDNNAMFSIYQNNAWIKDTTRSNQFTYAEVINALYASLDKNLGKKWEARIGLRAEETIAHGVQQVQGDAFTREYVSPFATAYLTFKMDSNNHFELNYGRRIDRPDYQLLNPFIYYSFKFSYSEGNPYLQPEYTNSIELKHSYKNTIITTLRLSATNNIINDVVEVNNTSQVVYSKPENIAVNKSIDFFVIYNKNLFKWWTLNASASAFYNYYNGLVDNNMISNDGWGYVVNMNCQFNLKNGWKAEVVAYHVSGYLQSVIERAGQLTDMTFGVSKKIKDKFNVKGVVNDPLYLYQNENIINLPNFHSDTHYKFNSRRVELEISYNFGKQLSQKHESTGPDEAKRMKMD